MSDNPEDQPVTDDHEPDPLELARALATVRADKARTSMSRKGRSTAIAGAVLVVVIGALFATVAFGGTAGAWAVLVLGVGGLPLAAGGWLVVNAVRVWRAPLAAELPDEPDEADGHSDLSR
jgi:hypothetical protein